MTTITEMPPSVPAGLSCYCPDCGAHLQTDSETTGRLLSYGSRLHQGPGWYIDCPNCKGGRVWVAMPEPEPVYDKLLGVRLSVDQEIGVCVVGISLGLFASIVALCWGLSGGPALFCWPVGTLGVGWLVLGVIAGVRANVRFE